MIELTAEMIIEIHDTIIHATEACQAFCARAPFDYLVDRINDEPDHFKRAALLVIL